MVEDDHAVLGHKDVDFQGVCTVFIGNDGVFKGVFGCLCDGGVGASVTDVHGRTKKGVVLQQLVCRRNQQGGIVGNDTVCRGEQQGQGVGLLFKTIFCHDPGGELELV